MSCCMGRQRVDRRHKSGTGGTTATNENGPRRARYRRETAGVADGTRTHDDQNHNLGLYQLSYSHRRAFDYSGLRTVRGRAGLKAWLQTPLPRPPRPL